MRTLALALGLAACGGAPPKGAAPPAPGEPSAELAPPPRAPSGVTEACVVVHDEPTGESVVVEGTLHAAEGAGGAKPFVLRLARPRCVVGLPGASFLSEVHVASTGFDLRPLDGARIRATGEAFAASSELGGPGVVVIASSVERAAPPAPSEP